MLTFVAWLVVLLGGAAALFLVGRGVFRKALSLGSELGRAGEVVSETTEQARRAHEERLREQAESQPGDGGTPGPGEPLVPTAGLRWARRDDEPGDRPATDDSVRA